MVHWFTFEECQPKAWSVSAKDTMKNPKKKMAKTLSGQDGLTVNQSRSHRDVM